MEMAESMIFENKDYIGEDIAEDAINRLKGEGEKGGNVSEKKQIKRGRPKATAK